MCDFETIVEGNPNLPRAMCLAGERAAPPDDCGGIWGYQSMVEAGLDPDHPDHEQALEQIEWTFGEDAFDPAIFDIGLANMRLAKAAATRFQRWWFDEDD